MKWLYLMLMLFSTITCLADDSTTVKKRLELNGYIKNLESYTFQDDFRKSISGNFLHNRINMQWNLSARININAAIRNRLFWGEEVKMLPDFSAQLRNQNEAINLQKAWIQNASLILHSNAERLNLVFQHKSLKVITGRQRINWGITTAWNPNDIFNAYNFLDFDYEERPGVDACRIQYSMDDFSGAEAAFALLGTSREIVSAMKYNLNKWGYDIQLNAGWYKNHPVAGAGWAGNILDAGFRGEVQYYLKNKASVSHLNLSLEADYVWKSGWYLSAAYLLNNRGMGNPLSSMQNIDFQISPENLMPTRHNVMLGSRKEITPLLSFGMNLLYAPGTNLIIFFPSLRYNLAPNLDADLIWQSFFAELNQQLTALNHRGFLRLKLSF
jgi:hypothetical protein